MEKEITLVTAYYELPKKKFTSETYINWIIKYLNLIKETNIVIYTNTEYIIELILKIRKDLADHSIEKVGSKLRDMMPWIGKNKLIDSDKS